MPALGEFVLGDELARRAGAQRPLGRAMRREPLGRDRAVVLRLDRAAGNGRITPRVDPGLAHRRQTGGEIDARVGLAVGTGGVIDAHRRLVRVGERDFAERHANVGVTLGRRVDLMRAEDRSGGDALGRCRRFDLWAFVHGLASAFRPGSAVRVRCSQKVRRASSLRRHDPDQVQRVRRLKAPSQPARGAPRVVGGIWDEARRLSMDTRQFALAAADRRPAMLCDRRSQPAARRSTPALSCRPKPAIRSRRRSC